jgi:very-short-patch-repair endonuclease
LDEEVNQHDLGRAYDLEKFGIRILRFTNKQIFTDMKTVIREISSAVSSSTPL